MSGPTAFPASAIVSGTIDTARLGSGTANSTTFHRGDQTWQTIDLSGYVPYTGATGAVNIGSYGLTCGAVTASGTVTFTGVVNSGTNLQLGSLLSGVAAIEIPATGTIYTTRNLVVGLYLSSGAFIDVGNGFYTIGNGTGLSLHSSIGTIINHGLAGSITAATGQFRINATNGVAFRNVDNSADAAITCGAITASGVVTFPEYASVYMPSGSLILTDGNPRIGLDYAGKGIQVGSGKAFGFSSAGTVGATASDTQWMRVSANSSKFVGADGTTPGAITCGAITASGRINVNSPSRTDAALSVVCDATLTKGLVVDGIVTGGPADIYQNRTGTAHNAVTYYLSSGATKWAVGLSNAAHDYVIYNFATATYPLLINSAGDAAFGGAITASGPVRLGLYTFATVPTASSYTNYQITISDRAARSAYSDGTNWRFCADDAIIS